MNNMNIKINDADDDVKQQLILKEVNSMCKTMDWSNVGGFPKMIPLNSKPILKKCEKCITNKLQNMMAVGPYPCLAEPDELWEKLLRATIKAYLGMKMAQIQEFMAKGKSLGCPKKHNVK